MLDATGKAVGVAFAKIQNSANIGRRAERDGDLGGRGLNNGPMECSAHHAFGKWGQHAGSTQIGRQHTDHRLLIHSFLIIGRNRIYDSTEYPPVV